MEGSRSQSLPFMFIVRWIMHRVQWITSIGIVIRPGTIIDGRVGQLWELIRRGKVDGKPTLSVHNRFEIAGWNGSFGNCYGFYEAGLFFPHSVSLVCSVRFQAWIIYTDFVGLFTFHKIIITVSVIFFLTWDNFEITNLVVRTLNKKIIRNENEIVRLSLVLAW